MLRPLKNVRFFSRSRKAKILTTGIHRVFRGLKFEPDTEIGQKRAFFKGLMLKNYKYLTVLQKTHGHCLHSNKITKLI
jgi:hypothetical protein